MGRKEFNERLEELNDIRKSILNDGKLPLSSKKHTNAIDTINREIVHLKLLLQN